MKPKPTTAFILGDNRLYAETLCMALERANLFQQIFVFCKEDKLSKFLIKNQSGHRPTLLLAYHFKERAVLATLDQLLKICPSASIVVIGSNDNHHTLNRLRAYKPAGIFGKADGFNALLDCLISIGKGEEYTSPSVRGQLEQISNMR